MLCITGVAGAASLTVYDGALENSFADYYSWASTYSFASTAVVRGSETHAIAFTPNNWGGVRVLAGNGNVRYPISAYGSLTFWVHGGSGSGQKVNLSLQLIDPATNQSANFSSLDIGSYTSGGITAGTWKQVVIDFDAQGLTYGSLNALTFQDGSGTTQPQIYLTDIVFNARGKPIASGAAVNVSVDTHNVGRPVNPLIFGVAYGDSTRNGQIGYSLRRWGGNSTTRYNWQVDVNNTGSDYFFENIPNGRDRTHTPPLDSTADKFIRETIAGGSQPLMTIPTIGWTPRADSALAHPFTVGFSVSKYGSQQQTDPYDPNAGNGNHPNGSPITGNDPVDSSTAVGPVFQQQWIAHMQSAFGGAAAGGVRYFTLDNEVMLWNSTHRDVHPNAPTEDEIWSKSLSYGNAIKQQDANARVTGPVTWGYCDLFWSASDNCGGSNADRNAHGGLPFIAWYLQQNCANGRPVDYLDLHYYPQGNGVSLSDDDSPATGAKRLRSLKELYDAGWVSESWIGTLGNSAPDHLSVPNLLPRVHAWINQYCPNTSLALTEYNWGNDDTTTGAIAQAEALAIFAREGVDMAARWVAPAPHTLAENAYSIFLDYDNAGSKVGGNSVAANSSAVDLIGAYAFDIPGQRTLVLLTNKDVATHDVALTFNTARTGMWRRFGFDGSNNLSQVGSASPINGASLTVSAMPPMSASLIEVTGTVAATVPGAPTNVTATAGNAQATVTFTAPTSNGGSAITGYAVTSNPAGGVDSNAGMTGLSHMISGLTNGTAYTFTVTATNAVGTGPASAASNSVTPTAAVPGGPNLNQHGLTGAWYNANTSGQGFVIETYPDLKGAGKGYLAASWYTFDVTAAGGQRWYTLQGDAVSGGTSVALTIYASTGGNFNAGPTIQASPVGTATLSFADCGNATLNFNFNDGRSGGIALTRLDPNVTCTSTGDSGAPSNYLLSGAWYNQTTSGQGFVFEVNPKINLFSAAWYTYAPSGASIGGGASERWYTIQDLTFAPGTVSKANLNIYETTGGAFNSGKVGAGSPVGTATIAFQSCTAATLSYIFTSGTNAGRSGSIALTRVVAAPPGCTL